MEAVDETQLVAQLEHACYKQSDLTVAVERCKQALAVRQVRLSCGEAGADAFSRW